MLSEPYFKDSDTKWDLKKQLIKIGGGGGHAPDAPAPPPPPGSATAIELCREMYCEEIFLNILFSFKNINFPKVFFFRNAVYYHIKNQKISWDIFMKKSLGILLFKKKRLFLSNQNLFRLGLQNSGEKRKKINPLKMI